MKNAFFSFAIASIALCALHAQADAPSITSATVNRSFGTPVSVTVALGDGLPEAATLYAAIGEGDGGSTPSNWDVFVPVATLAAGATSYTYALPAGREGTTYQLRLFFAETTTPDFDCQLESITSDGSATLDLGVYPTQNTRSQMKFVYTQWGGNWLLGNYVGNDNEDYRFFGYGDSFYFDQPNNWRINGGGTLTSHTAVYELEIGNNYVKNLATGQNILTGSTDSYAARDFSMHLFCNSDYGTVYYLKIYDGNAIVRDFVPCRKNGEICLFDTISCTYFHAEGGTLSGGAEVPTTAMSVNGMVASTPTLSLTIPVPEPAPDPEFVITGSGYEVADFIPAPAASNLILGVSAADTNSRTGSENTGAAAVLTDGLIPSGVPAGARYTVGNYAVLEWKLPANQYSSLTELRFYSFWGGIYRTDIAIDSIAVQNADDTWTTIPSTAFNYGVTESRNTVGVFDDTLQSRRVTVRTVTGEPFATNAKTLRITFGLQDHDYDGLVEIEALGGETWTAYGSAATVSGPLYNYDEQGDYERLSFSVPGCKLRVSSLRAYTVTVTCGDMVLSSESLGILAPGGTLIVPTTEGCITTVSLASVEEGTITAPSPSLDAIAGGYDPVTATSTATITYSLPWAGSADSVCSFDLAYGPAGSSPATTNALGTGLATGASGSVTVSGFAAESDYVFQLVAVNDSGLIGATPATVFTTPRVPFYTWTNSANTYGTPWKDSANWLDGLFPDIPCAVADFSDFSLSQYPQVNIAGTVTVGEIHTGPLFYCGLGMKFANTGDGSLVLDNGAAPARIVLNDVGSYSGGEGYHEYNIGVPVKSDGEVSIEKHRLGSFFFRDTVSVDVLTLGDANRSTISLSQQADIKSGLDIHSGTLATTYTGAAPFGVAAPDVAMGSADACRAAILSYPAAASDVLHTLHSLELFGPSESFLSIRGTDTASASLSVGGFRRTGTAALAFRPSDFNRVGETETFMLPASFPRRASGMLPPWAVFSTGWDARFAAVDANGSVQILAGDSAPGGDSEVLGLNNTTLSADASAIGLRLNQAQSLNLNGHTLTLGDGTDAGLILILNSVVNGSNGGSLDWQGTLYAYVADDHESATKPDDLRTATIRDALAADASGVLAKTGYGRLVLESDTLPADLDLQILNGTLQWKGSADTVFDPAQVSPSGAGLFELSGVRKVAFSGTDLRFPSLGLYGGASATVGEGQTLAVRNMLKVDDHATLVFTNGASYVNGTFPLYIGDHLQGGSLVASGRDPATGKPTTLDLRDAALVLSKVDGGWSQANNNSLIVTDGAVVTNVSLFTIGENQGGHFGNRALFASGAQFYSRYARLGSMCMELDVTVTGEGTVWDNGGGDIEVAESGGGNKPYDVVLTVSDGALLRNAGSIQIGRFAAGSLHHSNGVRVLSGGRILSSGNVLVGYPSGGGGDLSNHFAVVEGEGSLWNLGGASLLVGESLQGTLQDSYAVIRNGGRMENVGVLNVGRLHACDAFRNSLIVTNGATLASSGAVQIGYASANQGYNCFENEVLVADDSTWDVGGARLWIGNRANCNTWVRDNALRIGRGGTVANAGDVLLGYTWNASRVCTRTNELDVAYESDENTCRNDLVLEGGTFSGATLTAYPGNGVRATIGAADFGAAVFSGTATFQADSYIHVDAADGAPTGKYLVLSASSLVGIDTAALMTDTPDHIRIMVEGTSVYAKVVNPGTLLLFR